MNKIYTVLDKAGGFVGACFLFVIFSMVFFLIIGLGKCIMEASPRIPQLLQSLGLN